MKVPMTAWDFLHRAENVHGARIGIFDEPDAPGGGLGEVTYARKARNRLLQQLQALGHEFPVDRSEPSEVPGRVAPNSRPIRSQSVHSLGRRRREVWCPSASWQGLLAC